MTTNRLFINLKKSFFYHTKWGIAASGAILFLLLSPVKPFIHNSKLLEMDKLAHLFIFGGLTALCIPGLRAYFKQQAKGIDEVLIAAVYSACLGWLIEFLQSALNTGRSFEWYDGVADSVGAVLVFVFYKWLKRK